MKISTADLIVEVPEKGGMLSRCKGYEYYGKDIEMTMTVLYDPDSGRCRIERIDGKLDSEVTFPEGRFYIVNRPDESKMSSAVMKYKLGMLINDKPLTYNAFDQAMIEAGVPDVDDIDVIVTVDTLATGLNYDVVDFRFVSRKTRLKLRYGTVFSIQCKCVRSGVRQVECNGIRTGLWLHLESRQEIQDGIQFRSSIVAKLTGFVPEQSDELCLYDICAVR